MFPDERTRFAWFTSLLTGNARSMLSPHLKHHNPLRFTTVEQVLDLFRLFYSNPDEVGEAKNELAALIIKGSDEFYVFCAEFVKLASLAGIPLTEWKYELNRRLTLPLRQLMLTKYLNKAVKFETFRSAYSKTHQQIMEINRIRNLNRNQSIGTQKLTSNQKDAFTLTKNRLALSEKSTSVNQNLNEPIATSKVYDSRSKIPAQPATLAQFLPSVETGSSKCFTCSRTGYYANDCPNKATIGLIEPEAAPSD
jgi:hypothetical protein